MIEKQDCTFLLNFFSLRSIKQLLIFFFKKKHKPIAAGSVSKMFKKQIQCTFLLVKGPCNQSLKFICDSVDENQILPTFFSYIVKTCFSFALLLIIVQIMIWTTLLNDPCKNITKNQNRRLLGFPLQFLPSKTSKPLQDQ